MWHSNEALSQSIGQLVQDYWQIRKVVDEMAHQQLFKALLPFTLSLIVSRQNIFVFKTFKMLNYLKVFYVPHNTYYF